MATDAGETADGQAHSPSVLWKAFDVLDAFSHLHRVMSLSEIARRSGLPKSTTHRILTMLLEVQAVEREGAGYKIGIRMFTMGALSVDVRMRDLALPHLERLRRLTRQTVHLGVLQDGDVVYLEKLPSLVSPPTPALVGGRMPAARTGVGKALLAFSGRPAGPELAEPIHVVDDGRTAPTLGHCLEAVRRTGVAHDRGEAAPGLSCIAVPILSGGRVVAAVSVAFRSADGTGKHFINPLRETAAALGRTFSAVPPVLR